jgi:quinol monooxygenase YgiN
MKQILAGLVLTLGCLNCAIVPQAEAERLLVEFPVDSEQRDAFIEELHLILVDTRAYEGCLEATVWTNESDPDKVWIYEEWESRDNQVAYVKWRSDTGNTAHLGPYITGEVRFLWLNQN